MANPKQAARAFARLRPEELEELLELYRQSAHRPDLLRDVRAELLELGVSARRAEELIAALLNLARS